MIKFKNREQIADYIKSKHSICEIGVKDGEYFSLLVKNNPQKSVAVDLWDYYTIPSQNDLNYNIDDIKNFEKSFRDKFKDTQILKMSSLDASYLFDDNTFDLIYIDADHSYESIKLDLIAWYSKLKNGGIFAGHDYCEYYIESTKTEFGVIKAVNEFVFEKKLEMYFQITSEGSPEDYWKSWVIFKP